MPKSSTKMVERSPAARKGKDREGQGEGKLSDQKAWRDPKHASPCGEDATIRKLPLLGISKAVSYQYGVSPHRSKNAGKAPESFFYTSRRTKTRLSLKACSNSVPFVVTSTRRASTPGRGMHDVARPAQAEPLDPPRGHCFGVLRLQ